MRLPGRTRARTGYPRSSSTRATCQPRKPEAPVTRTGFIKAGLGVGVGGWGDVRFAAFLNGRRRRSFPTPTPIPNPQFHRSIQLSILKLSVNFALMPNAAEGSNPQCIMQCSQRGSLPGP